MEEIPHSQQQKKNCFQKFPVNKIKKKCDLFQEKTLKGIKENLNKSHTMMMNLRVNIKKYPTVQRID